MPSAFAATSFSYAIILPPSYNYIRTMKWTTNVAIPFVGLALAGAVLARKKENLAARAIPNLCGSNGVPDPVFGTCACYFCPGGGGQDPPIPLCMDRHGNDCASDVDLSTCCCGCCCTPFSNPQLPPCAQVANPIPEENCDANMCVTCCDCQM
ncbi:hypothetical protein ASPBRDRAFT_438022, partial [Aspergillus brasiliensis CBS 101740]